MSPAARHHLEKERPSFSEVWTPELCASLGAWLDVAVAERHQQEVKERILDFVMDYPDLINAGRTWPEIDRLAERRAQ